MLAQEHFVVYEWEAWDQYLIQTLLPRSIRLPANYKSPGVNQMKNLPAGVNYLLFHLNLSVIDRFPPDRRKMIKKIVDRGIIPLNSRITNITKPAIHKLCGDFGLSSLKSNPEGPQKELLIIKTSHNYGGEQEKKLPSEAMKALGIPRISRFLLNAFSYRVMPRSEIPSGCWRDPGLTIERFVSNTFNRFWRAYVFFDRMVVSEAITPSIIKKMNIGIERHNHQLFLSSSGSQIVPKFGPVDTSTLIVVLRRFINGARLSFGTIDVVEDDSGNFYIVDLNTTPFWGNEYQPELLNHLLGAFKL